MLILTICRSIVIECLEKYAKVHGPRVALVFAYCRYTEPVPVQQILAALIRQLLERYPFIYPLVKPVYDEHRREMTKPSKAQLLHLLGEICKVFDILFCALDGLDEAAPDVQFDLLKALSSVKANFFITSRPLEPLHSVLPEAHFFKVVARDEDIELLVRERLHQDPGFILLANTPEYLELQIQIVAKVKRAAGGM
jgi:ankyrin repeat domain-containing protein 50